MGKIVELEPEDGAEFAPVKRSLFGAVTKFGRADFKKSAMPPFCTAATYPPGFKKPDEGEDEMEEDDGTVSGDMIVSLVAKCPLKELPGYEAVLAKLVSEELESLPKSVYYVSPAMRHRGEVASVYY